MNMKEMMMEYLKEEGFCPQEVEIGLHFKFEGCNFLFFYDEDDNQFFRLAMPCIYEVTDENVDTVLRAMNNVNTDVKVVKLYTFDMDDESEVWVGFEVLVDTTPVLEDFVPRGIRMMRAAQAKFYEEIQSGV